jgi:hypothetical protein
VNGRIGAEALPPVPAALLPAFTSETPATSETI